MWTFKILLLFFFFLKIALTLFEHSFASSSCRMILAFSAPFMKLTCKVCPRTWATWSYSPHPARPPLLCLWHYHQMTRIQKLVRGFLFRTSLIHASPFTAVILTPNFETGVGIFELHILCVKPTLEQLGLTLSALYLKSTGHILAKFNYLFSQGQRSIWPLSFLYFILFFLLDWNITGIADGRSCASHLLEVRQWKNTETVITHVR